MSLFLDARIPVVFGDATAAGEGDALLVEGARPAMMAAACDYFLVGAAASHPPSCPCCTPRGAAAEALGRLFLARARGRIGLFRRVVAVTRTEEGVEAVKAAVRQDAVAAARFRLG